MEATCPHEHHHWSMTACEHLCRGAILYFGITANTKLFFAGAAFGAAWGTYNRLYPSEEAGHCEHGCGTGLYERLSGAHMPAPLALIAGTAILVTHIQHHLLHTFNPFVPLAGWTIACYAATQATKMGQLRCAA